MYLRLFGGDKTVPISLAHDNVEFAKKILEFCNSSVILIDIKTNFFLNISDVICNFIKKN